MSLPTRKIIMVAATYFNLKGIPLNYFTNQALWLGDRKLLIRESFEEAIGIYHPRDCNEMQDVVFLSNGSCCDASLVIEAMVADQNLEEKNVKLRHYVVNSSEKSLTKNQWNMINLAVETSNLFGQDLHAATPCILGAQQITLVAFLEEGQSNSKVVSLINKVLKARLGVRLNLR